CSTCCWVEPVFMTTIIADLRPESRSGYASSSGASRLWGQKQKQPQDRVLRLLRFVLRVGLHSSARGLGGRIKVSVKPKREPGGDLLHRAKKLSQLDGCCQI